MRSGSDLQNWGWCKGKRAQWLRAVRGPAEQHAGGSQLVLVKTTILSGAASVTSLCWQVEAKKRHFELLYAPGLCAAAENTDLSPARCSCDFLINTSLGDHSVRGCCAFPLSSPVLALFLFHSSGITISIWQWPFSLMNPSSWRPSHKPNATKLSRSECAFWKLPGLFALQKPRLCCSRHTSLSLSTGWSVPGPSLVSEQW